MILVGDIGATNTRVALFSKNNEKTVARYKNSEHSDVSALLQNFLQAKGNPQIEQAVFGVAGVVSRGRCSLTNIGWTIDEAQ